MSYLPAPDRKTAIADAMGTWPTYLLTQKDRAFAGGYLAYLPPHTEGALNVIDLDFSQYVWVQ